MLFYRKNMPSFGFFFIGIVFCWVTNVACHLSNQFSDIGPDFSEVTNGVCHLRNRISQIIPDISVVTNLVCHLGIRVSTEGFLVSHLGISQ
ncbi:MAG: hypothetical protein PCFJNLEI_04047 [Verrucomicrobiae bacterium]|nr:hypothetical protein [Verrucomicrobiae bacterium]